MDIIRNENFARLTYFKIQANQNNCKMVQSALKQLRNAVVVLLLLIGTGTIGYMIIEGWNVTEALYMVIITIITTGFEEVHPLLGNGEVFTLFLVLVSFITVFYIGGIGIHILIERKIFRRRRMEKKIEKLENHYIVCRPSS